MGKESQKKLQGKESALLNNSEGKGQESNILDYPLTGIKSSDATVINPSSRFNELYEKYKKIRETKRVSEQIPGTPSSPYSSILKSTSPEEKEKGEGEGEEKKKRHVQFVEELVVANKEESLDEDISKPKRKRRSKCRIESSVEETQVEELPRKKKASKS